MFLLSYSPPPTLAIGRFASQFSIRFWVSGGLVDGHCQECVKDLLLPTISFMHLWYASIPPSSLLLLTPSPAPPFAVNLSAVPLISLMFLLPIYPLPGIPAQLSSAQLVSPFHRIPTLDDLHPRNFDTPIPIQSVSPFRSGRKWVRERWKTEMAMSRVCSSVGFSGLLLKVDDVALDDVPNVIDKYHLCVVKNRCFDSELIGRAVNMKLLMQFGVGVEGIDVDAATRHNIKVARIPGSATGNSTSCAEMAIYLTLGLLRKQKEMDVAVRQKNLGVPIGETMLGKTVFIFGFGAIGVDLAKRLRPFGVKILAAKRRWSSNHSNDHDNAELASLVDEKGGPDNIYEFAGKADIVVTCLSLNNETVGIVDENFLSSMRKGSLLVNIARGGLLDYKAVFHHLQSGHLGGLAIDVAWTEPFDPEDPILKFPNVLITPHLAGVTEHSYRKMAKIVGDTALQLHYSSPLTEIEFVN
ncbi:hypothetical protein J5N97_022284 [Dioscorea zingiberensis]|uniref:Uncharacterized protein n=1 Tax=Dioscorea zingiberensis TaxID=325984 RepID=A0A9D5HAP0_9LILI|nr:hypothetical protein J5N97_022284 [Dioscorea zingiberensis]